MSNPHSPPRGTYLGVSLNPRLTGRPSQQSPRNKDKNKNDRFVLLRVSFCSLLAPVSRPSISSPRTETSRVDVLLFRALARRQLVVQTKLAIAVVAAQRSVFLRALDVFVRVLELGAGVALVEVEEVVDTRF